MFGDDSNFFCSNKKIQPLLLKENLELGKYLNGFEQKIIFKGRKNYIYTLS